MVLVRAALCEDEDRVRGLLARSLQMEFVAVGIGLAIDSYADGEALLAALAGGARYDVYFLDIEMPGVNGIEVCRQIRRGIPGSAGAPGLPASPDALVVFVSNKEELVFQSLEVQPFRFMRKSHFVEEQEATVHAIAAELERRRGHIISLSDAGTGKTYRVDVNELVYVEVLDKRCTVHTTAGTIDIRCRLADIEALLEGQPFLKPHRSYLVNGRFVFNVGRTALTLTTGEEIPLSRNRAAEVKQQFLELVREEI